MPIRKVQIPTFNSIDYLLAVIVGAGKAWALGKKLFRGYRKEGTYEVLEYESELEIHDLSGKKVTFSKRKRVRYLQDNIIAFQDYGWGDGEIMQNYKSKPGIAVDKYKIGFKTFVLLSLREVKNSGDVDEFNIRWQIKNGFLSKEGFWETDISHLTKKIKVAVLFPKKRQPSNIHLLEANRGKSYRLPSENVKRLPNGRWKLIWERSNPRLYEHYVLKWNW